MTYNKYIKYKSKYMHLKKIINIYLKMLQNKSFPSTQTNQTKDCASMKTANEIQSIADKNVDPTAADKNVDPTAADKNVDPTANEIQSIVDNVEPIKQVIGLPVFELYQYNIVNYPQASTQLDGDELHFTSIVESEEECGVFAVQSGNLRPNTDSISICDIISDTPPLDNKSDLTLMMKDLEANYYHYLLAIHNLLRPKYFNKDNIVGSDLYNRETIIDSEIVNRMLDIVLPLYQEHNIKVVRCEKDDRFIIMGDFHGSLHSFIRILFRLHLYNVLDIKTLILQPNYKMVFLGDIVDRGMFSTEILFTILLLIKNNKERVIFIAGNHEASTQPINSRDGFETEILFKYNDDTTLYRRFNQLFAMLPVAVLLHEPTNNQTVWLSHGCFNSSLDYNLSNYVYKNTSTIPIRGNNFIDSILWSDIHYLDGERSGGDSYKQNKRHLISAD